MRPRFGRRERQGLLPFRARQVRRERTFRRTILTVTAVLLVGTWFAIPGGRSAVMEAYQSARRHAIQATGLEIPRTEIDAAWQDRRDRREAKTRARYRGLYEPLKPAQKAFLQAAGMTPDDVVIRWGNYDLSLVMSSKVFDRDDAGRYYRLKPNLRSVWLRGANMLGLDVCQFLVPETPEMLRAAAATGATVIEGTAQTTNSWGCRGPEPDLNAPTRVLVLGDSFMQGYFVSDDQTPPACLQRRLEAETGAGVAVLNTGHLGYSPEHYYNTLLAYGDRFRPHLVVVANYTNDFGDEYEVAIGKGDWGEAKHWLDKVQSYCRSHGVRCLFAPIPFQSQLSGVRRAAQYPGMVADTAGLSGPYFCDATDAFVNADLQIRREHSLGSQPKSPLYNGHMGDGHFSPQGAAIWGKVVARRIALILSSQRKEGKAV